MNNHIYSTLFKIQERKADRRSKEIEQRKESQNTHIKQGQIYICIRVLYTQKIILEFKIDAVHAHARAYMHLFKLYSRILAESLAYR